MNAATRVVNKYLELIHTCNSDFSLLGSTIPIPIFSECTIAGLCDHFIEISNDLPMIEIDHDVIVVGDIHGNLHNLFAILNKYGFPPKTKYLFLGNLIDYGEFSLEVLTLLLAYHILYPDHVNILRGSTESISLGIFRGLKSDVEGCYGTASVYENFVEVFAHLPFCAIVFYSIFCCQPEILHKFKSVNEIMLHVKQDEIPIGDKAYDLLVNIYKKTVDEKTIDKFLNKSGMEFCLMGNCPDQCYFHKVGRAIQLSGCSEDYGCVAPIEYRKSNEIEVFMAIEGCSRHHASYSHVKDNIAMSSSNKSIIIPHVGSKPQLKNIRIPEKKGSITPAKSVMRLQSIEHRESSKASLVD